MGERVCLGVITGARGLKGEVWIKPFTADPMDVGAYGPVGDEKGGRSFVVRPREAVKGRLAARIEGVADRNAAEALKGVGLYIDRSALPATDDDEYYHSDLIGIAIEDGEGKMIGSLRAIHDFGAGDILEIAGGDGATLLVPFTRETVPVVDLAAGRMVIHPLAEAVDEGDGDGE